MANKARFALDYRSAGVDVEAGRAFFERIRSRVEATRTLKKVSVLQSAGLPEFPLEPRRLYNLIVFVLTAFLLAGVLQLLSAIVRDHKD